MPLPPATVGATFDGLDKVPLGTAGLVVRASGCT
jgi:hypothetical protein